MISLLLPYWNRQEATDKSLCLMAKHYMDLDLEIIIVDDGSPIPFEPPTLPLDIGVVRLERKLKALNPCVPYNVGFDTSIGDFIAISNPEILHNGPVLGRMRDAIENDNDYVMAAAWCPELKKWHAHSSLVRGDDKDVGSFLPKGAQYHFLTMMKRSLYPRFDEDYRHGAGYDDPDFVMRLKDANFIMRDDLIVEHPRSVRSEWQPGAHARNRELFLSKWA